MSYNFIWVPSYGSAVTTKPNVKAMKFVDGYEARIAIGINNSARKWQVSLPADRTRPLMLLRHF